MRSGLCLPITHVHVVAFFYYMLQGITRSMHGYVVHIRCLCFRETNIVLVYVHHVRWGFQCFVPCFPNKEFR